jgi:aminoglycoside 6-adenylyltransferase
MLEWEFGVRTGWAERPPHNGSRISSWAAPDVVHAISASWSDYSVPGSVDALRSSIALFATLTQRVASALHFRDDLSERASAEVEHLLAAHRLSADT